MRQRNWRMARCRCGESFPKTRPDREWCSVICYVRNHYYLQRGLPSPYIKTEVDAEQILQSIQDDVVRQELENG